MAAICIDKERHRANKTDYLCRFYWQTSTDDLGSLFSHFVLCVYWLFLCRSHSPTQINNEAINIRLQFFLDPQSTTIVNRSSLLCENMIILPNQSALKCKLFKCISINIFYYQVDSGNDHSWPLQFSGPRLHCPQLASCPCTGGMKIATICDYVHNSHSIYAIHTRFTYMRKLPQK